MGRDNERLNGELNKSKEEISHTAELAKETLEQPDLKKLNDLKEERSSKSERMKAIFSIALQHFAALIPNDQDGVREILRDTLELEKEVLGFFDKMT